MLKCTILFFYSNINYSNLKSTGRERKIADIPIDHPSCSKQHAVIQFRLIPYNRPDGSKGRRIRPYIIDLGSANGTFVNGTQIESSRYVELFEKDILKFGFSSREYVILHEESKGVEDESDGETSSPPPPLKRIKAESTSTSATSATSTSTSTSTQSKVKKEVKVEERREGRHRDRDHRDRDRHGHRDEKAKVKKEKLWLVFSTSIEFEFRICEPLTVSVSECFARTQNLNLSWSWSSCEAPAIILRKNRSKSLNI